jgi:hypothetical protein
MKRRDFLKHLSALSASRFVPVGIGMGALAQQAHGASPNYAGVNVTAPAIMPQVINIFMYGGASELAGNLTNIQDINVNSVNPYDSGSAFGGNILLPATNNDSDDLSRINDGQITANGFWKRAGGTYMENMLASNDMAVYRTIYKQKSPTRSHRESIFMSHKGTLDIENSPGIGSRLALMLKQQESSYGIVQLADGRTVSSVTNNDGSISGFDAFTLPFVSFEGDTQTYALDPENPLPVNLRGLTMDDNFNNPYTRGSIGGSETAITDLLAARNGEIQTNSVKYGQAFNGFKDRENLDTNMETLQDQLGLNNGTTSSADSLGVTYPGGNFSDQIEAAVTLALHNPQTLYMAVGTPGLGGWDDHNNGVDRYPDRMNSLMAAISAGMEHIRQANLQGITTIQGNARTRTDNIIINVFGDFGRLVNLNNSMGWDHANNQNLYTFGGVNKDNIANSVRPPKEAAAMGSIIGETERQGTSKTNNQFTVPKAGSPTFEPMCIASSVYGYFGATNPQVLTASASNESGDGRLEDGLPD